MSQRKQIYSRPEMIDALLQMDRQIIDGSDIFKQAAEMIYPAREWAMPTAATFDCPPIRAFVKKYLESCRSSADPFSRNQKLAMFTNDLDPDTEAQSHMEAHEFLTMLPEMPELILFDPPYSPRQISEHYRAAGKRATKEDCQNVRRKREREIIAERQKPGGIVLSFGWNSTGMGKNLGYKLLEILLVNHGSAHNDTICVAEQKL